MTRIVVMFSKYIKRMIIKMDNVSDIKRSTYFDKSSFYAERDSSSYLLRDSNILENIVGLIHKEDAGV